MQTKSNLDIESSIQLDKKKSSHYVPKRGEESVHNFEEDEKSNLTTDNDTNKILQDNKHERIVESKTANVNDDDMGSTPEVKFLNESSEHGVADEYSPCHGGKHSSSSGSVVLKTSWFNFAAPP